MDKKIQELEKYIYEKFYKGDEFWELVWKYHILKVKEIALKLAEEEDANKEILLVASILHDISQRDFGIRNHAKKSSEIAEEILKDFGFKEAFIKRVCEIIRNHHNYQKNLNKEDVLLKLADGLASMLNPFLSTTKLIVCGERPEETVKKLMILNKKGSEEFYKKWKYENYKDIVKTLYEFYSKLDAP